MSDAYDLLNQARALWQQNAMAKNNAGAVNKNTSAIPINMKTPYGYYEVHNVYYDDDYGIVFEWNTPKVQLYQD